MVKECPEGYVLCADGTCASTTCTIRGCPVSRPVRCMDGSCTMSPDECEKPRECEDPVMCSRSEGNGR